MTLELPTIHLIRRGSAPGPEEGIGRSSSPPSQSPHTQECQVLKNSLCAFLSVLQSKAIHHLKRTGKVVFRWVDFSPQMHQGCHCPSMSPAANPEGRSW
jgi:hypothetical protein